MQDDPLKDVPEPKEAMKGVVQPETLAHPRWIIYRFLCGDISVSLTHIKRLDTGGPKGPEEIGWQRDTKNGGAVHAEKGSRLEKNPEDGSYVKLPKERAEWLRSFYDELFDYIDEQAHSNRRQADEILNFQSREKRYLKNFEKNVALLETAKADLETAKADRENLNKSLNKRWFLFWAGSMLLLMTVCIWIVMNSIPPLDQ